MQNSSLSSKVWKINWTSLFPYTLKSGIQVEYSRYEDCKVDLMRVMKAAYKTSDQQTPFSDKSSVSFKESYYQEVGDFFLFRDKKINQVIGIGVCVLKDHASIDFRTITLMDEYQNQGIYPEFMALLASILKKHGVSRIEGDLSPTNTHHHQALARMGACFTGMTTSTAHGVLIHAVVFLNEDEKERFTDLFSETGPSDKHSNDAFRKKAS